MCYYVLSVFTLSIWLWITMMFHKIVEQMHKLMPGAYKMLSWFFDPSPSYSRKLKVCYSNKSFFPYVLYFIYSYHGESVIRDSDILRRSNEEQEEKVVLAGESLRVPVLISSPGTSLYWSFTTDRSIDFQLSYTTSQVSYFDSIQFYSVTIWWNHDYYMWLFHVL